jgi:hypothetical protein
VSDRKFGFRQQADVRDHRYTMPPVLVGLPADNREVVRWDIGQIRDQGREGACVGFGCKALLEASPFRQTGGLTAREIYLEARMVDEFDDSEVEEGTSVRAGLNVLKTHGLIQSYVWATGVEDVLDFLAKKGPVVLGVTWHGYETEADGRMRFDGPEVGGHCILATGHDRIRKIITFQNSWGISFGHAGEGYITESDLKRELNNRGGCAAGVIEKPRV